MDTIGQNINRILSKILNEVKDTYPRVKPLIEDAEEKLKNANFKKSKKILFELLDAIKKTTGEKSKEIFNYLLSNLKNADFEKSKEILNNVIEFLEKNGIQIKDYMVEEQVLSLGDLHKFKDYLLFIKINHSRYCVGGEEYNKNAMKRLLENINGNNSLEKEQKEILKELLNNFKEEYKGMNEEDFIKEITQLANEEIEAHSVYKGNNAKLNNFAKAFSKEFKLIYRDEKIILEIENLNEKGKKLSPLDVGEKKVDFTFNKICFGFYTHQNKYLKEYEVKKEGIKKEIKVPIDSFGMKKKVFFVYVANLRWFYFDVYFEELEVRLRFYVRNNERPQNDGDTTRNY